MGRMFVALMVSGLMLCGVAMAQDLGNEDPAGKQKKPKAPKEAKAPKAPKEAKAPKAKPELLDLTLTGKIEKVEDEKGKVSYTLTTADGTSVKLPAIKAAKGEDAPAIKIEDYVDTNVIIVGKGTETKKDDKTTVNLKSITSLVKNFTM